MTTTTLTALRASSSPGPLRRILNVARLILVNKSTIFGLPLLILTVIFVGSLLVWWIVGVSIARSGVDVADGESVYIGGASFFLVVYMLVVAVQAINLTFPFAQGYSVTRRDFYLGSALAFVGLSVVYAILMAVLGSIEDATSGWGLNGQMFSVRFLGVMDPVAAFYFFFMALLFFFFIGAAVATLYVRWRMFGLLGFFTGLTFLLIGLIALFTLTNTWAQVESWFAANGAVGVATWSLVPTALAGIAGFFILRKATPRN